MRPKQGGPGSRTEEIRPLDRIKEAGKLPGGINTSCPQDQYPALCGLRNAGVLFLLSC